jgi:hypothetical protein
LDRLRLEHHRPEIEVLTVVLDDWITPESLADRDGFVDPATAAGKVKTRCNPLSLEPAGSDPEFGPTARYDIEGCDSTSRDKWVPQADVVNMCSETDLICAACDVGEIRERIEDGDV